MRTRSLLTAVLPLLLPPALASAQNLVANPGFENGLTGWSGSSGALAASTQNPRSGAACLRVEDASATSSVSATSTSTLAITQGQAYELRVFVRAEQDGQQVLVSLNQLDAGGAWISGHNYDFVVTASTGWTEFSTRLRSFASNAASVVLNLRPAIWTDAGELTGVAYFDDVVFQAVADPGRKNDQATWLVDPGPVRVWRSPAEQKVLRDVTPSAASPRAASILIEAAQGEAEPAQIVLETQGADSLTGVTVSDLAGPSGASIPSTAFQIREVAYVQVVTPTDYSSMPGWTADPLPLFSPPLALAAGRQQPLWLTVRVPQGAKPGDYAGTVHLTFQSAAALDLPITVHVFGFALPKEHHLRTAYGLGLWNLDRYHHLNGDPALRRQVFQLYLGDFAEHRVSPYDPMGDDLIEVGFPNLNWPLDQVVVDPDAPTGTNHVMKVVDDAADATVAAGGAAYLPVTQGSSYTLAFRARTDSSRSFLVALMQYRADHSWISGHNVDTVRAGTTSWASFTATVDSSRLAADAAFFKVALYACPWTAAGELTGATWFDDVSLKPAGGGAELVPNGGFELTVADAEPVADFSRADPALAFALDDLGLDSFRLPVPYFGWGNLGEQHPGSMLGYDWTTPEYATLFGKMVRSMTDHLAQRGWLGKAYTYWFDEPFPSDYAFVGHGMDLLHAADPRLKRLLTEEFQPALAGKVDLWSPLEDLWAPSWSKARQALGEEVWWYVCTGPKAPYPNEFIDHAGIEHRVRFWMAWQLGVQGDLYWDTTYWTCDDLFPPPGLQDPWTDPMSKNNWGGVPGEWGNGDGRLLYPPRSWKDGATRVEGPTPSLRWELIREGLEDYEYLWLLRDAAGRAEAAGADPTAVASARALLDVPPSVFGSTIDYSNDSTALLSHRRSVALALEGLLATLSPSGADAGAAGPDAGAPRLDAGADGGEPPAGEDASGELADSGKPPAGADASTVAQADGSSVQPQPAEAGCGCSSSAGGPETVLLALALFALAQRTRGVPQ